MKIKRKRKCSCRACWQTHMWCQPSHAVKVPEFPESEHACSCLPAWPITPHLRVLQSLLLSESERLFVFALDWEG